MLYIITFIDLKMVTSSIISGKYFIAIINVIRVDSGLLS